MAPRRKGLLVILDGLGDRPVASLDRRTPLEAARTITFDRLAQTGLCGLIDPLAPGIPVDTATGTGILLGAPPHSVASLSRGPVEAAGVGMRIAPGDVALRCNFATVERVENRLQILDRRAGRIRVATEELAESLDGLDLGEGITARLAPATQHRAVLRLSGHGLSDAISDTDPGVVPLPAPVLRSKARQRGDLRAARTAAAVNRFVKAAHERLREHPVNRERTDRGEAPANGIITRGAGQVMAVRGVIEQLALSASVIAGESTVIGLAGLLEMEAVTDSRFTGLPDTDLAAKVDAAAAALENHDLVFLHVKGADICSHDRDPEHKRDFLAAVDGALSGLAGHDLVIGLTGDHSTDCVTGNHTGDPVPALIRTPEGRADASASFGETSCMSGGLGRLTASSYLMVFLDAMGAVPEWRSADPQYSSGTNLWLE